MTRTKSWIGAIANLVAASTLGIGVGLASASPVTMPASVDAAIAQGQSPDVLVALDSRAIDAAAEGHRARGARYDDANSLAFKAREYRALKNRMLAATPKNAVELIGDYSHLPMMLLRLHNTAAANALVARKDVVGVYENRLLYPALAQSLPLIGQPTVAGAGDAGSGTAVVVLDTGVNYALANFGNCTAPNVPASCRVVVAQDLALNDGVLDDSGHGTNVSGIVAAVSPGAKLAVFDVFSGASALSSTVIAGINWAIANQAAYNIVAINMSLGDGTKNTSPCASSVTNPFLAPITSARSAGLLTVIASGNNQYIDGISNPACTPGSISVGAVYDANVGTISYTGLCSDSTTATDKVTCFSNSAGFLAMLAPGALITAAGTTQAGTSQATPHVAGAVAVLRAAFANDSLDQTLARMVDSGTPVVDARNGLTYPRLNLLASARPDGDSFAAATVIDSASGQTDASNVLASKQSGEPNHAGNAGGASVWFTWTATASGTYVFTTQGSSFDTLLAIYQGSGVNALTPIASNNDDGGAGGTSSVTIDVVAGQTYVIAVDGYNGVAGAIHLAWNAAPPVESEIPVLPSWGSAVFLLGLAAIGIIRRRAPVD